MPYSERVTKMKLSAGKRSIRINESLTLTGIPPETFDYRLGSRSAFDWIINNTKSKANPAPTVKRPPLHRSPGGK